MPKTLDLIDRISEDILINGCALPPLYRNFLRTHRWRLTEDLQLFCNIFPPACRVLEIGSSPFVMTAALKASGFKVIGVDLLPEYFRETVERLNLSIVKCNIETETLPFDDHSFSCIVMMEVFEHLRIDVISTMMEIKRVLRPGGVMVLSTPNLFSLRGIWNLLIHQRASVVAGSPYGEYSNLKSIGAMGHVREYTSKEVQDFMEQCGFKVRVVMYRGHCFGPGRVVTQLVPSLRRFMVLVLEK